MQKMSSRLRTIIIVLLLILLVVAGLTIYRSSRFHIVATDPKLSSFSASAPYLRVYFNDTINASSLKVTDDVSEVISRATVNGKTVTFYFKGDLTKNLTYTIKINSVGNTSGEVIKNKSLSFVAQDIPYSKLSKAQKQTLINNQDKQIYEATNINYVNFDNLLQYGISDGQLLNIESSLYDYSNVVNQKYRTMTLDPNSIVIARHDPSSADRTDSATFTTVLGAESFTTKVEYDLLYDSVHVLLLRTDGSVAYDSANNGD